MELKLTRGTMAKQIKIYPILILIVPIVLISCVTSSQQQTTDYGSYEMLTSKALGFFTGHVQGIAFSKKNLFLSAVDKEEKVGYLFKIDPKTYYLIDQIKMKIGNIFHPGGISFNGEYLYLPLAGYKPHSSTIILKIDPDTMEPVSSFVVNDHIGAVTTDGEGFIFGMNWDARDIYIWDTSGNLLKTFPNKQKIAYQDIEYSNGILYCSGIKIHTLMGGRVDLYKFDRNTLTLTLKESLSMPQLETDKVRSIASEAMTLKEGYLYFVPEDFPKTKLYRVKIE